MRTHHRLVIGVGIMALTAGCSGGGGGPTGYNPGGQSPPPTGPQPTPSTSNQVLVQNNQFNPAATTVAPGTTVTWSWDSCSDDGYGGKSCTQHSVVFDDGGLTSPAQSSGSVSRRFDIAGTFAYRCGVHGSAMSGQVVVR